MTEDAVPFVESVVEACQDHVRLIAALSIGGAMLGVALVTFLPQDHSFRTVLAVGSRSQADGQIMDSEPPEAVVSRLMNVHLPIARLSLTDIDEARLPVSIRNPRGSSLVELATVGPESIGPTALAIQKLCVDRAITERSLLDQGEIALMGAKKAALIQEAAQGARDLTVLEARVAKTAEAATAAQLAREQLAESLGGMAERNRAAARSEASAANMVALAAEAERINERLAFFDRQIFDFLPRQRLDQEKERSGLEQAHIARELRRAELERQQVALTPFRIVVGPAQMRDRVGPGRVLAGLGGFAAGALVAIGAVAVLRAVATVRARRHVARAAG